MTKAKKPAPPPSRFDGEAIGLVLFAFGLFLLATLLMPTGGLGIMMLLRKELLTWLIWAAYTLPAVPLCYGLLIFLGRPLRNLSRRVMGSVVVVISLLCLQQVFAAQGAGRLAAVLMGPLHPLSYLAAVWPLVTLTLGLEVILNMRPFSLLKGFFRGLIGLTRRLVSAVRRAQEGRAQGREKSQYIGELRQGHAAHQQQLAALLRLYPGNDELKAWHQHSRATHKKLRGLKEDGFEEAATELDHAQNLRQTFVRAAATTLQQDVSHEAPPEAAQAQALLRRIRTQQHELGYELPTTTVSAALERVRQSMVMELQRLCTRLSALERSCQQATDVLRAPDLSAQVLSHEYEQHEARLEDWQEASEQFYAWQERAQHYQGWPALAASFDAGPPPAAQEAVKALLADPDETLAQHEAWAKYAAATQEQAREQQTPPETDHPHRATPTAANPDTDNPDADNLSLPHTAQRPAAASHQPPLIGALGQPPAAVPVMSATSGPQQLQQQPHTQRPTAAVAVLEPQGSVHDERDDLPLPTGRKLEADTLPWQEEPSAAVSTPATRRRPQQGALEMALPDESLLDPLPPEAHNTIQLDIAARQRAGLINETLAQFGLSARVVDFARGPTVTRYEIEPAPGEKISRIASLSNDLARALAVGGVRVEAPVPGKSVIGLEVPNTEREPVNFHSAINSPAWKNSRAKLPILLGKSIDGELMVGDLAKMPHLLIAGSTGAGKSVCVNTLITSLLYRYLPTELRFLMIDPKMVELTPYDGIPHLVRGVVTNPVDAAGVLLGAVAHMERRYKMMSQVGAKNLEQFNTKMRQIHEPELPHLVIIIDELADLMITSPKEVESAIMRLAQMARATGMHLILATQRPSVDILTSLIKVNVPARIAFAVSSSHDSRTILDAMGAERLTGMGDMLFYQPGLIKPVRLQGPYISEAESVRISDELRRQVFDDQFVELYGPDFDGAIESGSSSAGSANMDFSDPYLRQAAEICIEEGQGSVSRLQRRLSVGHARAGKLMDMLEAMGIVSKHQGSKPRDVLINREDLPEYFGK